MASSPPSASPVKGVMLSKRPPEPGAAGAALAAARARVFTTHVHEGTHPGGRNPLAVPRETPHPGLHRPPPQFDALAELAFFVRRRVQLRRRAAEAAAAAAARRARRAAVAQALRSLILGGAGGEAGLSWADGSRTAAAIVDATAALPAAPAAGGAAAAATAAAAAAAAAAEGAATRRPAWARSSAAEESREEAECADMLAFASALDADEYLQGLEDNAGVALVQEELRAVDSQLEAREASAAAAGASARALGSADSGCGGGGGGGSSSSSNNNNSSSSSASSSSPSNSSSTQSPQLLRAQQQQQQQQREGAGSEVEGKSEGSSSAQHLVAQALSELGGIHSRQSLRKVIAAAICSHVGSLGGSVGREAMAATLADKLAAGELALV